MMSLGEDEASGIIFRIPEALAKLRPETPHLDLNPFAIQIFQYFNRFNLRLCQVVTEMWSHIITSWNNVTSHLIGGFLTT